MFYFICIYLFDLDTYVCDFQHILHKVLVERKKEKRKKEMVQSSFPVASQLSTDNPRPG